MEEKLWANIYCQNEAVICGRHVWHYLIGTSIGNISVVEYENTGLEIQQKVFTDGYNKAEKFFQSVVGRMARGKI